MVTPPDRGDGLQPQLFPPSSGEAREGKESLVSGSPVGDEERRLMRNAAERLRKRLSGQVRMSREEYLDRADHRRREAVRMREEGFSVGEIAGELGITTRRVRQLLKEEG